MAVVRLILRLSSSRPRPLAAVPALLRLVVVPCLNAHKRHVRDALYSFNSLHGHSTSASGSGVGGRRDASGLSLIFLAGIPA